MADNKREWRDMKRQAGCVWGCLTEPFVLAVLALAAALGLYTYHRKVGRSSVEHPPTPPTEDEQSHD